MTNTIPLTQGFVALVDDEDYERCNKHKWYACFSGTKVYARTCIKGKIPIWMRLHRFIMSPLPDQQIDHINNDGLDNRKENLRIATSTQNIANTPKHKTHNGTTPSSKYKGVCFFKATGGWVTYLRLHGKQMHLGYFTSEIEAAKAYDKKAKELFGEFAKLNFP